MATGSSAVGSNGLGRSLQTNGQIRTLNNEMIVTMWTVLISFIKFAFHQNDGRSVGAGTTAPGHARTRRLSERPSCTFCRQRPFPLSCAVCGPPPRRGIAGSRTIVGSTGRESRPGRSEYVCLGIVADLLIRMSEHEIEFPLTHRAEVFSCLRKVQPDCGRR